MFANNAPETVSHSPRGIVIVNNQKVNFKSFRVEENAFSAANTFEITLPWYIGETAARETLLSGTKSFQSELITNDNISVQIYCGYPVNVLNYGINDLTQLITGTVDTLEWDFDFGGEFIRLSGRNIIGKMLDSKIIDKHPNATSSQIAQYYASKYNLKTAITNTKRLAGTFYNNNSALLPNSETTEWDLLLFLAKEENFVVRVKGDTLMFGSYETVTSFQESKALNYTWGKNIGRLHIERTPFGARNIVVKVISLDRNSKTRIVETAKSSTGGASKLQGQTGESEAFTQVYTIPGLTREQAQKKAQAILRELSLNQLIGDMDCSGNVNFAIDRLLKIDGVGAGLSRDYFINKVMHEFDSESGYSNNISFSNQFLTEAV